MITDHTSAAHQTCKRVGMLPCKTMTPCKFSGPLGSDILKSISDGQCTFLHIHVPALRDLQPYEAMFWERCSLCLHAARDSGTLVALSEPLVNNPKSPSHRSFLSNNNLHTSKHHWCHWKIERHGLRSKAVHTLLSNRVLPDHACQCEPGILHSNLFASDQGGNERFKLFTEFSKHLLASFTPAQGYHSLPLAQVPAEVNYSDYQPPMCTLHSSSRQTRPCLSGAGCRHCNVASGTPVILSEVKAEGIQSLPDSNTNSTSSHDVPPPPTPSASQVLAKQLAYPTASKERERIRRNERKAQGIDPKSLVVKKKKYVEPHFDDCGDDLSSIASTTDTLLVGYSSGSDSSLTSDSDEACSDLDDSTLGDQLDLFHVTGWRDGPLPRVPPTCRHATNVDEFVSLLTTLPKGLDVVELCGGEGRTSRVAVRRHLRTGDNFDLVTGCDLNDPSQQRKVYNYIKSHKVFCVVMAPTCTPFGNMSHLSKHVHPEAWKEAYKDAAPHGRFCGEVALLQLKEGRHFINEQPDPSDLYDEQPWPEVLQHPRTVTIRWDRCMTGLTSEGLPAKKASRWVASDPLLIKPFENRVCPGTHTDPRDLVVR